MTLFYNKSLSHNLPHILFLHKKIKSSFFSMYYLLCHKIINLRENSCHYIIPYRILFHFTINLREFNKNIKIHFLFRFSNF